MTVDNCASIFGKDSVHTPIPYSLKALLQTLQFHGMHTASRLWRSVPERDREEATPLVISFRKARLRSAGRTCIQTALSRMKSKDNPRRKVCSRPGSRSEIQRMRGSGWRRLPLCPHGGRWFDGHNLMAVRGQPRGVAPGASADIEDQSRSVR